LEPAPANCNKQNIESKTNTNRSRIKGPSPKPHQLAANRRGQKHTTHVPSASAAAAAAPPLLRQGNPPDQCRLQRAANDGPVHVPGSGEGSNRSADAAAGRMHQGGPRPRLVHRRQRDQLHGDGQRHLQAGSALQVDVGEA